MGREGGEQPYEFACIPLGVVFSAPYDILKGEPALMPEILLTHPIEHLTDAAKSLCGHNLCTFAYKRIMERYRQMAFAFFQEPIQTFARPHGRYRDATRRPCTTIIGGHDLQAAEHVGYIIHRFALTHIHEIGERAKPLLCILRQRFLIRCKREIEYLIEDIRRR